MSAHTVRHRWIPVAVYANCCCDVQTLSSCSDVTGAKSSTNKRFVLANVDHAMPLHDSVPREAASEIENIKLPVSVTRRRSCEFTGIAKPLLLSSTKRPHASAKWLIDTVADMSSFPAFLATD
eukprot:6192672-Pleurochrysis_carterae.AAC.2